MADLFLSPSAVSADDLEHRAGFDPGFLGVDVPMPGLAGDLPTMTLAYTHYSVLFRPDRRLAAVTAVDLDGAHLFQIDREGVPWALDPRLAPELQTGPAVYARNDLDRGHLVRRASSCWGADRAEAEQGNVETFYYTNAAPQAALFNQGHELWLGLEDYLQEHAATFDRKLVVLAGPVLDPADPPYRGVQIPLRFWKVVAFLQDGALAATGYLLDQSPLVSHEEVVAAEGPPPLGAYRTFQVPIASIAALAGVRLDELAAVDQLHAPPAVAAAPPPAPGHAAPGWVELHALDDVRFAA
ncbi:MAG: DNA/RNA non-specific endonuclease [Blastococcus sp.]